MSLSEDQLRSDLSSSPDDWSKRLKLVERLADRWAGREMDMLLTASPVAPATESEMRRVVDLANAHCPGYRGLIHVLGLFLETHLTSSWAHFILAQALFYTGDEEAALRHYQTSKSLNPSRSDEELDALLSARGVPAVSAPVAEEPAYSPAKADPATIVPVPPKKDPSESPSFAEPEESEKSSHREFVPEPDTEAAQEAPEEGRGVFGDSAEEPVAGGKIEPDGDAEGNLPPAETDRTDLGDTDGPGDPDADDATISELKEENGPVSAGDKAGGKKAKPESAPGTTTIARKAVDDEAGEEEPDSPIHIEPLSENGEPLSAAKKEDDSRQKLSALSIALIAHVVILFLFAFWQVVKPRQTPPKFVSSVLTTGDESRPNRPEIKRYQRPRMPSASAKMQIVTVPAVSMTPVPEMNKSVATFDPVGNGDSFGPSMSFGGGGGGSVSFFGSKSTSKRVVFVVDVSASMGGSKDLLMRKELIKSIEALPPTVEYALIFFGGPAWYSGQKVGEAGLEGQWIANVVQDGSRRYVWYEGWSEKERHDGTRTSALYHYSLGEHNLPRGPYQKATKTAIRKTVQQIQETPLIFGTDWRWPLMMAMNMKPDTIFFMTDGAFGTGRGVSKDEMIQGLLEHNRKTGNARINTICMMVLQARKELEQLARGTQGEFTLVLQDGSVVRGRDLDNQ